MLPYHPLFSEAAVLQDPHQQWARLSSRICEEDRQTLDASFRLVLRAQTSLWRKPPQQITGSSAAHAVRTACILALEWDLGDRAALATALMHNVLEDCAPEDQAGFAAEIERAAGASVLQAVWWLTRPSLPEAVPADTKGRRDAEFFRAIRTAPYWVRLVKCADRLDSLREALTARDRAMWSFVSTETMGWHLYLARETFATAEAELFATLVEGERQLNGTVPIWADGHLVDPVAARALPEHIARHYGLIGIARRGSTLVVGTVRKLPSDQLTDVRLAINAGGQNFQSVEPILISGAAFDDATAAQYRSP